MKKNKNIPLNLREQMNSRIGLTCSVILLVLLVIAFRQLDYNLIEKPKIEAQKAAEEKKAAAKRRLKNQRSPQQALSLSVIIFTMEASSSPARMIPEPGTTTRSTKRSRMRSRQRMSQW